MNKRMTSESGPSPPQASRFGPVTLLALAGGVVMGLVGVLVAQSSGSPDTMRGILVTSVFLGVGAGVFAGTLVERGYRLPRSLAGTDGHWFRFQLWHLIGLMTVLAVYCGALAGLAGWLGIGPRELSQIMLSSMITRIPYLLVYLFAAVAFLNRLSAHRRASRYGLAAIAILILASASTPFYHLLTVSQRSSGNYALYLTIRYVMAAFHWVGMVLILVAALVDRDPQPTRVADAPEPGQQEWPNSHEAPQG